MKNAIIALWVLVSCPLAWSIVKPVSKQDIAVSSKTIKVSIPGAVCAMCVQGMKKAFKNDVQNPKTDIAVNLDTKILTLKLAKNLSDDEIKNKVKKAGYNATGIVRM